jgi:hypothetical protein
MIVLNSIRLIPQLSRSKLALRTVLRGYHENIIDHYENPRNVGSLDKKKKLVGTGMVISWL